MTHHALRAIALAIAAAGMFDPALRIPRAKPLAVEVTAGASNEAVRARGQLIRQLPADIILAGPGGGDAVVAIDRDVDVRSIRPDVPVSFVGIDSGPDVRLLRASTDAHVFPGKPALITVDASALNTAGRRSKVTVVEKGVEIGSVDHIWTDAVEQRIRVPFVAFTPGSHYFHVASHPFADELRRDDNRIPVSVTTRDEPFSVIFFEHRPSWSATFVRQAIESDRRIRISSRTRASSGIDRRDGSPPSSLSTAALNEFDLVAVGAPEELRQSDVASLHTFMADRGGTVLLLLDRRPSGPVLSLIPGDGFDEVLLNTPVPFGLAALPKALRGSEFALPKAPGSSWQVLAPLPDGRAAIAASPVGSGTLIVSGALDAWRYRATGVEFATFWRELIIDAARQAPPALKVDIEPSVVRPGSRVRVTARLRRTEFQRHAEYLELPPISAAAVSENNGATASDFIRLWPASEPGVFQGEFVPSQPRKYTILARAGSSQAAAILLTTDELTERNDGRQRAIVSAATGGVVTTADRLAPLIQHLRARPRDRIEATVHPMRSGWWILPFSMVLATEWTIRRRRGEK